MKHIVWFAGAMVLGLGACQSPEEHMNPEIRLPDLGSGNFTPEGILIVLGLEGASGRLRTQEEVVGPPLPLFAVFNPEGKLVAESTDQEIRLQAGRYQVRPERGTEQSSFWVTVEPGKVSEVDLRLIEGRSEHAKR